MGCYLVTAPCGACGRLFCFNPHKVPSLNNVPFCKACVDKANPLRKEKGLPPITYAPDAYEPVCDEGVF